MFSGLLKKKNQPKFNKQKNTKIFFCLKMEMEIKNLEEQKLQSLANDPQNLVYHYVDRSPVKEVVPIAVVKKNIGTLWKECQTLQNKNAKMRRQILCESNVRWKQFSETHPDIFDRITHPETEQKHIDSLWVMIQFYEKEKNQQIVSGKQQFEEYMLKTHGVSAEEYRKQNPKHEIRQVEMK